MRRLLPFVCLLFVGCAAFFSESDRELGVIPAQPTTNVVIRATLPRDTRHISFTCAAPIPRVQGEGRVTVTLTNTSGRMIELGPGAVSSVAPHSGVQLFDGSLSALVGGRPFSVSTWSGRASCELYIRFASPLSLTAPMRVVCHRSSPPL